MANEQEPRVAEFIGSTEVCKRFGINRTKLTELIRLRLIKPSGKLPGVSGAYLWDPAYIDELVAAGGPPALPTDQPSWAPHNGNNGVPYDARDIS
ncbi:MAG TPA: hypothetical protein VIQ30_12730 [Pseudonocardia sp.]